MSCDARDVIEVMRILYDKSLITVLSGNASVKCGEGFLITPSGVPKHKISQLTFVDLNDLSWRGPKPSIEYRMHAFIYKNSDARAVVHAHNPLTVLLADLHEEALDPSLYVESRYAIRKIAVVERLEAGSLELAEAVGRKVREGADLVVLKGHGVIAWGNDAYDALNKVEAIEYVARLQLHEKCLKKG